MIQYVFDFSVVWAAWRELLAGCALTLEISSLSMVLAFVIGTAAAAMKSSKVAIAHRSAVAFIEVIRNTPFAVQIFFVFFGLPQLGLRLDPGTAAILTLGVNGGAYAAEIIRAGLESVHQTQRDAGHALGLSKFQIFRLVIFMPALRTVYPALCSQFILLMLASSIVSSISARELTSVGYLIEGKTFRSFEVYFALAAIYLIMSVLISAALKGIGRLTFSYPLR